MAIDILQGQIRKLKCPIVAGIDPKLEYIPQEILDRYIAQHGPGAEAAAQAVKEFSFGLVDAVSGVVPAVKPQSAFFERFGWQGMRVLSELVAYARDAGLYVIIDAKRGDIGSTAEAYADAFLGSVEVGGEAFVPFGADSVTINPYLGSDGITPFAAYCGERGKSVFVLVKTSNPSSGEFQDLICGERTLHLAVAELVENLARAGKGEYLYGDVGAVVGATYPAELGRLRKLMPHTFFLVPGYGAQGATADDISYAFDELGRGAIINASRSIMCAWQKTGGDYKDAARSAAEEMRAGIKRHVSVL